MACGITGRVSARGGDGYGALIHGGRKKTAAVALPLQLMSRRCFTSLGDIKARAGITARIISFHRSYARSNLLPPSTPRAPSSAAVFIPASSSVVRDCRGRRRVRRGTT